MAYRTLTAEDKKEILKLADGVLKNEENGMEGKGYSSVHAQFKTFPAKYVFEGIEAGLEPEEISDNVYNYMKYGTPPGDTHKNKTAGHAVPMENYTDVSFNDQENIIRFLCGKVLMKMKDLQTP